mgnify:FL=1
MPEHNQGMYAVPQILTNNVEDFLCTAKKIGDYGYKEVNLNLGCPSRTVVTKGRGAGFLDEPQKLDRFLDAVFEKCNLEISIKTRIGMEDPEEFETILPIYNKYPLKELIIHRVCRRSFIKIHQSLIHMHGQWNIANIRFAIMGISVLWRTWNS